MTADKSSEKLEVTSQFQEGRTQRSKVKGQSLWYNIPTELRRRRQWICWKYELQDGRLTKVPVAPWTTGHDGKASATDPNNMTSFNTAVDYASKNGWGIGFCFFSGDGLTGIDLDDLDRLGDEREEIIKKANSYARVESQR